MDSQPIEPMRDEVSDREGREFHPIPSWSVAAVPQMVERERCEGEQTLYAGHFVAGSHFDVGSSVELDRRETGGLPGRDASGSW